MSQPKFCTGRRLQQVMGRDEQALPFVARTFGEFIGSLFHGNSPVQEGPEDDGGGIAETGSDRRTEVSDSCGGLPHTRTFGIFVGFLSLKSERVSALCSVGQSGLF